MAQQDHLASVRQIVPRRLHLVEPRRIPIEKGIVENQGEGRIVGEVTGDRETLPWNRGSAGVVDGVWWCYGGL